MLEKASTQPYPNEGDVLYPQYMVVTKFSFFFSFFGSGDAFKAKTLIIQLRKLGCRLDDVVVASLITLYGKQQNLKQAEEVFVTSADSPVTKKFLCKSMLDVYVKCGKAEEAYSLYKQVAETGHCLDAVALSIVVNSLSKRGTTS